MSQNSGDREIIQEKGRKCPHIHYLPIFKYINRSQMGFISNPLVLVMLQSVGAGSALN